MVGSGNWCGTSVVFRCRTWAEFRVVGTGVEIRCLWLVVEVGCTVERRGRFVRGVSGN